MSFDYPLNHPNVSIKDHSFKLIQVQARSTSPFTRASQVQSYSGQVIEYTFEYKRFSQLEARKLIGFLVRMKGMLGTVYLGDPDGNLGSHNGSNLTIVSKASNNEIVCSGFTPLQQDALIEGDFISFSNYELKIIAETVNADASGNATIKFESSLRDQTIGIGGIVTTQNPKGIFSLSVPNIGFSSNELKEYEISLVYLEQTI
ncbi:MAG: hypothetical protein JKY89_12935 [Immundisolibacteraceae bacterium]|nr:hypothetical protein [Immundisolibacteraceae bacterium]